jgi:hypothetical protein
MNFSSSIDLLMECYALTATKEIHELAGKDEDAKIIDLISEIDQQSGHCKRPAFVRFLLRLLTGVKVTYMSHPDDIVNSWFMPKRGNPNKERGVGQPHRTSMINGLNKDNRDKFIGFLFDIGEDAQRALLSGLIREIQNSTESDSV